jgi:hypothetical protein
MCGRLHEDAGVAKVPDRQAEGHVPLLFVERHDPHLAAHGGHTHAAQRKWNKKALHAEIL